MKHVLITGARGFVGKNLLAVLRRQSGLRLDEYDLNNSPEDLPRFLAEANIIFHLAGVNRPADISEFETGNAIFTREMCSILRKIRRAPKIVFSSSVQAELDNPYGLSKRAAEEALREFADDTGAQCVIYRLKNLFGKWCRPHYNSVTATFCHNIAHDLPIEISDPLGEIELTYIDDVVSAFSSELALRQPGFSFANPLTSYSIKLGELAGIIRTFRDARTSLILPDLSHPFIRALYATYISYLDQDRLCYSINVKSDPRGRLAEFIKSHHAGQFFVSTTRPGVTRGNHYHDTKIEKFMVLQGQAIIRLRHVLDKNIIEYRVNGEDYRVVDIPPGYIHSIENLGIDELITIFWSDDVFDPLQPDTFHEDLLGKKA